MDIYINTFSKIITTHESIKIEGDCWQVALYMETFTIVQITLVVIKYMCKTHPWSQSPDTSII